ncbi:energy transducer TonB [Pseudomonadales bacterium]|jgi:protein TonB|nr:energy transducer TonB [Pseudomonadales bacterium]
MSPNYRLTLLKLCVVLVLGVGGNSAYATETLATNIGVFNDAGTVRQVECYLVASGPLRYPPKAKRYRYVGQVIVRFGISPEGKVVDPFVAESEPPGVFERAALMHVKTWRYATPTFEGKPITVDDVAVRLVFDPKRR